MGTYEDFEQELSKAKKELSSKKQQKSDLNLNSLKLLIKNQKISYIREKLARKLEQKKEILNKVIFEKKELRKSRIALGILSIIVGVAFPYLASAFGISFTVSYPIVMLISAASSASVGMLIYFINHQSVREYIKNNKEKKLKAWLDKNSGAYENGINYCKSKEEEMAKKKVEIDEKIIEVDQAIGISKSKVDNLVAEEDSIAYTLLRRFATASPKDYSMESARKVKVLVK